MHQSWTLCPECDGEPWNPVCTLCMGAGILDYTDYEPEPAEDVKCCPDCGFPLYTRERAPRSYCDECGKLW